MASGISSPEAMSSPVSQVYLVFVFVFLDSSRAAVTAQSHSAADGAAKAS